LTRPKSARENAQPHSRKPTTIRECESPFAKCTPDSRMAPPFANAKPIPNGSPFTYAFPSVLPPPFADAKPIRDPSRMVLLPTVPPFANGAAYNSRMGARCPCIALFPSDSGWAPQEWNSSMEGLMPLGSLGFPCPAVELRSTQRLLHLRQNHSRRARGGLSHRHLPGHLIRPRPCTRTSPITITSPSACGPVALSGLFH
jgi:hypothetical protein